jgi:hypothetical protein
VLNELADTDGPAATLLMRVPVDPGDQHSAAAALSRPTLLAAQCSAAGPRCLTTRRGGNAPTRGVEARYTHLRQLSAWEDTRRCGDRHVGYVADGLRDATPGRYRARVRLAGIAARRSRGARPVSQEAGGPPRGSRHTCRRRLRRARCARPGS